MKLSLLLGEYVSKLFLIQRESDLSLFLINPYKFMSGYLYFYNNLKDKRQYIGLHSKS